MVPSGLVTAATDVGGAGSKQMDAWVVIAPGTKATSVGKLATPYKVRFARACPGGIWTPTPNDRVSIVTLSGRPGLGRRGEGEKGGGKRKEISNATFPHCIHLERDLTGSSAGKFSPTSINKQTHTPKKNLHGTKTST